MDYWYTIYFPHRSFKRIKGFFFCMYRSLAKGYDELYGKEQEKKLVLIAHLLKGRILDIGAGTGDFLLEAKNPIRGSLKEKNISDNRDSIPVSSNLRAHLKSNLHLLEIGHYFFVSTQSGRTGGNVQFYLKSPDNLFLDLASALNNMQ